MNLKAAEEVRPRYFHGLKIERLVIRSARKSFRPPERPESSSIAPMLQPESVPVVFVEVLIDALPSLSPIGASPYVS